MDSEQFRPNRRGPLVAVLLVVLLAVVLLVAGVDWRLVGVLAAVVLLPLAIRPAWPALRQWWNRPRPQRSTRHVPPVRPARAEAVDMSRPDLLTACAAVLTLGCLASAILDSYTSLCVTGGAVGHVGDASACFTFGGWDTRVFPLSVDMGWAGALCALIRLSRVMGFTWRWWVVFGFEVVTALFTISGNAFHGAEADGAVGQLHGPALLVLSSVTSAVPGVVAVGAGFTLSVLISTHKPSTGVPAPAPEPRRSRRVSLGHGVRRRRGVRGLRQPERAELPPAASSVPTVLPSPTPVVSQGTTPRRRDEVTEEEYRAAVETAGPGAAAKDIAVCLGASTKTVGRLRTKYPDVERARVMSAADGQGRGVDVPPLADMSRDSNRVVPRLVGS